MGNYINGIHYDFYKGENSSENLVIVHGSGCNRKFLRPLAKELLKYNCYLIDLPDHGESHFMDCKSVDDYVNAVAGFVSELENVTLIGHSLGGTICLGVSSKGIPCVKRCVILSSGASFPKLDKRIHDMVRDKEVNWGYLLKCLGSLHCPSVLKCLLAFESPELIIKDFDIDIRLDLEYAMEKINIPTLIMVSKKDILTLPEYSKTMHKGIQGSRLIYFTHTRHMLPIVKRKQVAGLIEGFIDQRTVS